MSQTAVEQWRQLTHSKFKRGKKLNVTIQLQMSVPGGTYVDLAVEPLSASNPEDTWSSTENDEELNEFPDMVDSEEVSYEFVSPTASFFSLTPVQCPCSQERRRSWR